MVLSKQRWVSDALHPSPSPQPPPAHMLSDGLGNVCVVLSLPTDCRISRRMSVRVRTETITTGARVGWGGVGLDTDVRLCMHHPITDLPGCFFTECRVFERTSDVRKFP